MRTWEPVLDSVFFFCLKSWRRLPVFRCACQLRGLMLPSAWDFNCLCAIGSLKSKHAATRKENRRVGSGAWVASPLAHPAHCYSWVSFPSFFIAISWALNVWLQKLCNYLSSAYHGSLQLGPCASPALYSRLRSTHHFMKEVVCPTASKNEVAPPKHPKC